MSLWWRHNIYLWRHNGARRHARAKHYEYFMLENCTQTTRVYWSKNPFELLYIDIYWNYLRLNRAIFFKFWNISKISMFISSIGTSLFEVFPQVPLFKKMLDFSFHLLIPAQGQFVTIKTLQDEVSFGKIYFTQKQLISHTKQKFSGKVQIPKWAPFAPNGTANQIAGKSWNHRGQYWILNPMAPKPWISHPSVG